MSARPATPDILGAVLTHSPTTLPAGTIRANGGTQMRAQLDPATVIEYAEAMADGWGQFPPVTCYYDGTDHWLADGFHRLQAFLSHGGMREQQPIPVDVRSGSRRDAILHAAGANSSHGLRRTNADKRRAVEVLLRDLEWSQWSDHQIAKAANVDPKTVGNLRRDLTGEIPQSNQRKTAAGRTVATAKINANRTKRQPTEPAFAELPALEAAIRTWLDTCELTKNDSPLDKANQCTFLAQSMHGMLWDDMLKSLPTPWRRRDVMSALANVRAIIMNTAASRITQEQAEQRIWSRTRNAIPDDDPARRHLYVSNNHEYYRWFSINDPVDVSIVERARQDVLQQLSQQIAAKAEDEVVRGIWQHQAPAERPLPAPALSFAADIEAALRAAMAAAVPQDDADKRYSWMVAKGDWDVANERGWPLDDVHIARTAILKELIHRRVTARAGADGADGAPPTPQPLPPPGPVRYDQRAARLQALRQQYVDVLATFREYGDLTGRHTETLAVERGLRHLIDMIDRNLIPQEEAETAAP